jgi:hypothetical protein
MKKQAYYIFKIFNLLKISYLLPIFVGLLLLFAVTQKSYSQAFQGAVAIGSNLTQVDGDEVFGFKKFGLNASAIAIVPFKDKWSVSLEACFNQKGAYQKYPREMLPDKELPYYKLTLNYAEIPLMLHFTDKGFLTFGLGFSYGRLVGVKEIEWGIQTPLTLFSGDYIRDDYNVIFDVRAPIYKRLYFNFRYAYSLAKIRTRTYTNISGDEWTRDQYNNVLTIRLLYLFNEVKKHSND